MDDEAEAALVEQAWLSRDEVLQQLGWDEPLLHVPRGFVRTIYAIRLAVAPSYEEILHVEPEEVPIALLADYLGSPRDFGCPKEGRWSTYGALTAHTFRPAETLMCSNIWDTYSTFTGKLLRVQRLFAHRFTFTDESSWA